MRVLSLFDGISCGQTALRRAGIHEYDYYASEIDRDAIEVTQHWFPETIQLGDVTKIRSGQITRPNLIMGGSPCQGFSNSGKGLAFDDPRSKLFAEFVKLVKYYKPEYWLLENVPMKKEWRDRISDILGVQPVEINSALVSAQNRRRLYWSNHPIRQPEDRGIKLYQVVDSPDWNRGAVVGLRLDEDGKRKDGDKRYPIIQCLEVRKDRDKSGCLSATGPKDTVLSPLPPGRYKYAYGNPSVTWRFYTIDECCRLQTIPEGLFDMWPDGRIIGNYKARKLVGNAWTVEVITEIFEQWFGAS